MTDRAATTQWSGDLTSGSGTVHLDSSKAGQFDVSLPSRAFDIRGQTNPEELVAAAHSACYSMQLAALLTSAGTPPQALATRGGGDPGTARGRLPDHPGQAFRARHVPGVDADSFRRMAEEAKNTCPVSAALSGTEIVLDAELEETPSTGRAAAGRDPLSSTHRGEAAMAHHLSLRDARRILDAAIEKAFVSVSP